MRTNLYNKTQIQSTWTLFDICTKMHVLSCEKTFQIRSACLLILKAFRCMFCTQYACRLAAMKFYMLSLVCFITHLLLYKYNVPIQRIEFEFLIFVSMKVNYLYKGLNLNFSFLFV